MKVFYPPDVWSLSRFACGVSIFVCFYFELRRVLFTHTHTKVARETFFLPVNKSRNIELPVKSAREHFQKFHPWIFFLPVNISQKTAREAKSSTWSFSKPKWSRVSFRFTGKKKHCKRFTTSNVIVMLRLSLMVGMGWGVSLLKFSLWGLFSRRFYVSCPPFESALAFTHLFACFL